MEEPRKKLPRNNDTREITALSSVKSNIFNITMFPAKEKKGYQLSIRRMFALKPKIHILLSEITVSCCI